MPFEKTSEFRFAEPSDGAKARNTDPAIALMAISIALQQKAGFGLLLDLREFRCPHCKAAGFNSGWGTIDFTCGASWGGGGDDMDEFDPCQSKQEAQS